MLDCQKCNGRGYIEHRAYYLGNEIVDNRICGCMSGFLRTATILEIIDYVKSVREDRENVVIAPISIQDQEDQQLHNYDYKQLELEGVAECPF